MKISRRKFLLASGAGALAAPGIAGLVAPKDTVEIDSERGTSLWTHEAPELPSFPRFEGERQADLVIVGGGYTGLSCAYYAKKMRPDWTVIVLDSHTIGSGASSRNSGSVAPYYAGKSGEDAMGERGLNRLRGFIDQEQIECDFRSIAMLRMNISQEGADAARNDDNPKTKWLSPEVMRERMGTDYYTGAVEHQGAFSVHPGKLVAGHAMAALKEGAELFEHSAVTDIEHGKPAKITTPNGKLVAKNVFIATNAYTPRLGLFDYKMFPLHQYTLATRQLSKKEIQEFALDTWPMRFEKRTLPITFAMTPSGHFFVRIVLGYASHNSSEWPDLKGARELASRIFHQRFPRIAQLGLEHGWHGVTGHTASGSQIAGAIGEGNVHVSVAYNGLGIMPSHNNGYLTACNITGMQDQDTATLTGTSGQYFVPGDFYRSILFKPGFKMLTPV